MTDPVTWSACAAHVGDPRGGDRARGVGGFFDSRAGRYDDAYESTRADGHALRVRMQAALRLLGQGPGEVLDVGMGPGRLCAELAGRGWTVSGVDASLEMVQHARKRLPDAACRLSQSAVEALPFADQSFDAVTGTGVFEYVDDRERAFAEVARVLRPGGLAVLSIPNPVAAYALAYRVVTPVGRRLRRILGRPAGARPRGAAPVRRAAFERLLAAAGLPVETLVYTNFLVVPPPIDRALPGLAARLAAGLEGSGPSLGGAVATQLVFAARRVNAQRRPGGEPSKS